MSTGTAVRPRLTGEKQANRRAVLVIVIAALVAVAALWAVFLSPFFRVDAVEVRGASVLTAEQVQAAAGIDLGTPLARVDGDGAADRVADLAPVASVAVSRDWPGTVVVTVVERTPVLAVPSADGVALYDREGVQYLDVPAAPAGVALLDAADPPPVVLDEVISVLTELPQALRARLAGVRAPTLDSIQLDLTDGVTVVWGSADHNARKAEVLETLMKQPGRVYNVSAPEVPAIQP